MTLRTPARRPVTVGDEALALRCSRGRVVLIDDDVEILSALASLLDLEGYACETYPSALQYLQVMAFTQPQFAGPSCVLCDVNMPLLDGLELQRRLVDLTGVPMLLMSGSSGAREAVTAYRSGALDFLIKPIDADILLDAVQRALLVSRERQAERSKALEVGNRVATLTAREREIARRVAQGQINRLIADELCIALRTVKLHRQRVMEKLAVQTVVDLARLMDQAGL
jgi:FixJ family two-component response regulator